MQLWGFETNYRKHAHGFFQVSGSTPSTGIPLTQAETQFREALTARQSELAQSRREDYETLSQAYRSIGITLPEFNLYDTSSYQTAINSLTQNLPSTVSPEDRSRLLRLQGELREHEQSRSVLARTITDTERVGNNTSARADAFRTAAQRLSQVAHLGEASSGTAPAADATAPQRPAEGEGSGASDQANAANNRNSGNSASSVLGAIFGGLGGLVGTGVQGFAGIAGLCAVVASANARASAQMGMMAQQCLATVGAATITGLNNTAATTAVASANAQIAGSQAHASAMQAMAMTHLNRSPGSLLAGMNAECANGGGFAVSSRPGTVCA